MNKYSHLYFPEFVLKMERGVKQFCQICCNSFSVFRKEHICKRCLRSVCSDCSLFKVKTYLPNRNIRLHRNCNKCNLQSSKIKKYIQQNKLIFSQDSDLLYIWSKTLIQRRIIKVKRSKSSLKNYVSIENLWASLHYSFREFVGILLEKDKIHDIDLIRILGNGLEEIQEFYVDKLQQGLYIYLFFLCHCAVETSINLTLLVLEMLQKSPLKKDRLNQLIQGFGFSEVQSFKIIQLIMENEMIFKSSVSINHLPILASLDIVNLVLINKSIDYLWRGTFFVLFQRKQIIIQNLNSPNVFMIDLLRNAAIVDIKSQPNIMTPPKLSEETAFANGLMLQNAKLKLKNEQLVRQLDEIQKRSTHNLFNNLSSFDKFDDSLNLTSKSQYTQKQYNLLLEGKNEQIVKIKAKAEQNLVLYYDKKKQAQKLLQQISRLKVALKEKDGKIVKIQSQKQSLKNTNNLLINKMKELSNLLMDQQQGQMKRDKEHLSQYRKSIEQLKVQGKQQCIIY